MSNMLNALIPCSLKILFSPASTSLSPIYTTFLKLTRCSSPNHPKNSSLSSVAKPVKKLTGMPCTFPLSLVSGVLISACASTQISATSRPKRSLTALAVPATDPIAMEWSPPSVSTNLPSLACLYTCPQISLVTADTARGFFIPRCGGSCAGTKSA